MLCYRCIWPKLYLTVERRVLAKYTRSASVSLTQAFLPAPDEIPLQAQSCLRNLPTYSHLALRMITFYM